MTSDKIRTSRPVGGQTGHRWITKQGQTHYDRQTLAVTKEFSCTTKKSPWTVLVSPRVSPVKHPKSPLDLQTSLSVILTHWKI